MLSLTVAVPVPLVLFILTLVLVTTGFLKSSDQSVRMLWMAIGFCELLLAFICFVAMPYLFYLSPVVEYVNPVAFSLVSSFACFGCGLLILKGKI